MPRTWTPTAARHPTLRWATIRLLNCLSSNREVLDEHGMRVGSAPSADHLRRADAGVRGGVAGPGVATGPGAVPSLAHSRRRSAGRRASRWRWRWRAAPAGATWPRRSKRPGSRRTSPSRPTRRQRVAASIEPRPTGPTPSCCASCCSMASCPSRGFRRRSCWSGANAVRLYKSLVDQRKVWIQRIHAELFQHGVAVPEAQIRTPSTRAWLASNEVTLTASARQRIAVGYSMIDATDSAALPLKAQLQRFGMHQPACRALVEHHFGIGGLLGGSGVVRTRRLSSLLALAAGGAPHRSGRRRRRLRSSSGTRLLVAARSVDIAVGAVRSGPQRVPARQPRSRLLPPR